MTKIKVITSILLVIVVLFSVPFAATATEYGPYLDSMMNFMQGMYYKGLTDEEGLKAALKGMFAGLDKYSAFYDNAEMEAINRSLNGNFVGIGAALEKVDNGIKITKIYEGSPAEKAGILEGDIITAVNGSSILGKDAEAVAASIRGDAGTTVRLTIMRGTVKKEYSLVRATITISSVQYRIEGKTAYVRIDSFSQGTAAKFNEALTQINKNGIWKIILDLRGNPGGYVDEAVNVAKKILPGGMITKLDYRSEEMTDQSYYADNNNPKYFIAVLVDEDSASASEILAGALQDTGNSVLIGQKTYGKGVFQNLFSILTPEAYTKYSKQYGEQYVTDLHWMSYFGVIPTKNEILGKVKLTTGHYLTRNGRSIDGIGLIPQVVEPNAKMPNGVNLALINPITNTATMDINLYDNGVYSAERILKALGYVTAADKQYDAATATAVKKYQSAKRLPVTGKIDVKTRDQLNKTLLELRKINDTQYAKAAQIMSWLKD